MKTQNTITHESMIYKHYDNGIHEFIFTGQGSGGLDQMIEIVTDIMRTTSVDGIIRYIIDIRNTDGRGAMGDLVRRLRKLEVKVGERAAGRTAILHDGSVLLTLANTFLDTLAPTKDRTRFFKDDARDEAIVWLLNEV